MEVNQHYVHFYNFERPNQAMTCGNQPPRVKFPERPCLPPVPDTINTDRWLLAQSGKTYKRKLNSDGYFQLGNQTYYVQQKRPPASGCDLGRWQAEDLACICSWSACQKSDGQRTAKSSHEFP